MHACVSYVFFANTLNLLILMQCVYLDSRDTISRTCLLSGVFCNLHSYYLCGSKSWPYLQTSLRVFDKKCGRIHFLFKSVIALCTEYIDCLHANSHLWLLICNQTLLNYIYIYSNFKDPKRQLIYIFSNR